jgi:hypothetical protein
MVGLLEDSSTAADCAVYSDVIDVLLRLKSDKATSAVVKLALSGGNGSSAAVDCLCESDTPVAPDVLIKLAGTPTVDEPNCRVLRKMLKQQEPIAVGLYHEVLAVDDVYGAFRESMTPAIAEAFKAELNSLKGQAQCYAKMLIVGQTPDAVRDWIRLLEDSKWPGKSVVTWELAQLKDPRSLRPIVRCLRRAKEGYFKTESEFSPAIPITHCIDAIAGISGDDAIEELIGLLSVEFGRARVDYPNDADLHLYVAVALIELTGESFGVEGAAWSKWHSGH